MTSLDLTNSIVTDRPDGTCSLERAHFASRLESLGLGFDELDV